MTGAAAPVLFYAPMKPADHPTPSGDRQIARALLAALAAAGFAPEVASRLRTLDMAGDAGVQERLRAEAEAEVARLVARHGAAPPGLWVTYHCHHKAPDLVGAAVARALGMRYAIVEPSISPRRRVGPWAGFAAASEAAIAAADLLFWSTPRDLGGLEAAGHGPRLVRLRPWLDPGPPVPPRPAGAPLLLATVAMMRPGDKLESYRRLAAGLARLAGDWRLAVVGDGAARGAVAALLAPFGDRVDCLGVLPPGAPIRALLAEADLMVWPGVNEGVGMVWLEAQAAGCPVVAEDGAAARAVVGGGVLTPPDDPGGLASGIAAAAAGRAALSARATAHIAAGHTGAAAAATLRAALAPVPA